MQNHFYYLHTLFYSAVNTSDRFNNIPGVSTYTVDLAENCEIFIFVFFCGPEGNFSAGKIFSPFLGSSDC